MRKLAIITTHPIQYNAPLFRLLNERKNISIKVFYTWGEKVLANKFDPGFGKTIEWDIPLLEGYDHTFLKNISKDPGSHHYNGIDNPGIVEEINLFNPDAILVFGWSFKSHLNVMRHFRRKKRILFRGDSTLLDEPTGFSFKIVLRRLFLTWVYRHIDFALYAGKHNYRYFIKHGLKKGQLIFVPHAIDIKRFGELSEKNLRTEWNIPDDKIIFLFTGKFEQKKDPMLLLKAFISAALPSALLVYVGNGAEEKNLAAYAEMMGKSSPSAVRFIPFQNQSQMPAVYRSADVLVLPSKGPGETWGLAVNEAMAAGKAVLVSDKCGCSADLVQDGVNGYLFRSGDENDLRNKIRLMADRDMLSGFGKASRKIISEWSFENGVTAIEETVNRS